MQSPKLIGLLLVANLGMAGAVLYLVKSGPGSTAPAAIPAAAAAVPAVPEAPAPPEKIFVTNQWQWAQLESEDYPTYIARLRSIGCPEQTIRDIIIADLDKLLAPKVRSMYGRRPDLRYWNSEEEELANNYDHREWLRQEREIDREKRKIIQELVGVDVVRERLKQRGYEDYYERRLSFLPEEKRGPVRMLLEQLDDQEQQLRQKEQEEGEALTAEERTQLRTVQDRRRAAIAGLLTPAEQEQFELWLSPAANEVRQAMYGMDATEQEFLAVYNLRRAFDEKWPMAAVEQADDATLLAWQQAREQLDSQIRQQLGEQRYAEYTRGQDPDFHHLNATVSRYHLPREKAAEAYDMKRSVQQMAATVRVDPNLAPALKEEALKNMAQETELALRQLLGNAGYRFFQQQSQADWVGH